MLNEEDSFIIEEMLKKSQTDPGLLIDGIHFGRGNIYKTATNHFKHKTVKIKCWKIIIKELEVVPEESSNQFYDSNNYLVQWDSLTENYNLVSNTVLTTTNNRIFFYWNGGNAPKGYSPLPDAIDKDNPPVERITQWAEPPAFLQLFSGKFVVHKGETTMDEPRLYILRGEMEKEVHLFEVSRKKESLRSRTSFVLHMPQNRTSIVWHGLQSSKHCRNSIKKIVGEVFGSDLVEIEEGFESEEFIKVVEAYDNGYLVGFSKKLEDYTPRLFYFNDITGSFLATEIECIHGSSVHTPLPFLQSHLYTAIQPATFLLDDYDNIWIWQGWRQQQQDEDNMFKTKCFDVTLNYAKRKSKILGKVVRVKTVLAGFEPMEFTNLFPFWNERDDITKIQKKNEVTTLSDLIIEVNPDDHTK